MKPLRSPWSKRLVKILKWMGVCLSAILVFAFSAVLVARAAKAAQTNINTENGIQESGYVELNGIRQFVQIRGEHQGNPVILMLHGGPGSPVTFLSSYFQRALEKDFTLVNFDQRGSGRTYYANEEVKLSTQEILSDIDSLVDYLLGRFGQEKVIVLGHSWGTVLGSIYVKEHPEKVTAYIGVGQCVSNMEGDTVAAEEAIRRAKENGDERTAGKISELLDQYSGSTDIAKKFILTMEIRQIGASYFHYEDESSIPETLWLGLSSPDMSFVDMRWFLKMSGPFEKFLALEEPLLEDCLTFNLEELGSRYAVPVYYISGEHDWITPTDLVKEFYQTLEAPDKEMVVLPNAGHSPFLDDPEMFCAAVKDALQK